MDNRTKTIIIHQEFSEEALNMLPQKIEDYKKRLIEIDNKSVYDRHFYLIYEYLELKKFLLKYDPAFMESEGFS